MLEPATRLVVNLACGVLFGLGWIVATEAARRSIKAFDAWRSNRRQTKAFKRFSTEPPRKP